MWGITPAAMSGALFWLFALVSTDGEKKSHDIWFWQGKGQTQQELSKAKSKKFALSATPPLSLSLPLEILMLSIIKQI